MRKLTTLIVLSSAMAASAAFAADDVTNNTYNNYGTDNSPMTSTANKETVSSGLLKNEYAAIKPAAGVLAFVAPNGQTQARGAVALLTDINIARVVPDELRWMYFGITTGVVYGHLGSQTSNFFGANPSEVTTDPGANLLLIPANLEIGWNFMDNARVGAHGGGNVIYRSQASSLSMGDSSAVPGSVWRIFPNAGLDLDIGLARNVSLYLRPDYTFTPGQDLFSGTLGIGINMG